MSLNDFGFPQQRLRTVSAQLRNAAGLDDHAPAHEPDLSALGWGEWSTSGYSPDRPAGAPQPFHDPYSELVSENGFSSGAPFPPRQAPFQPGTAFEASVGMSGIEEEPAHAALEAGGAADPSLGRVEGTTPLLSHPPVATLPPAQGSTYPTSAGPASPARSRASSLHSVSAPPLQMSALTSPASPFFPQPLPSPFGDHRASFSSTINPSQSVRSSSPSDTSSVLGLNMSRIESSSATSSIYGGETGGATATAPSTPYRSGSISRQNSQRDAHQKHTRRRSSPIKTSGRHSRKLSNAERKAICQFHLAHPGWKQDDIGAHFGYERSTISKTLKFKDKYLAMDSEDEAGSLAVDAFPQSAASSSSRGHRRAQSEVLSPSATPVPQPMQSPGLVASSSMSSLVSLDSFAQAQDLPARSSSLIGSAFPQVDSELVVWAAEHVAKNHSLSDTVIQRQARAIARSLPGNEAFKADRAWLESFKARAGISSGAFHDVDAALASFQALAPPATAPTPTPNSHRLLDPPREEDDEDEAAQHEVEEDEAPAVRRSKRSIGSKTVRRLQSAKSTLAAFADGFTGRHHSPATARAEDSMGAMAGGSFGDLSMDSEATPTHSTVHSRHSTTTERASGLAQPFSYSPTAPHDASTPSRMSHQASGSLVLGDYSPTNTQGQLLAHSLYGPATGLEHQCQSHDLGASYASTNGLSASSSQTSLVNYGSQPQQNLVLGGMDTSASPAPSIYHRRSGSTASSTSVYSGLTAFSSQNGPGTPLTGSLYGSFRDSQGNLCSVPGTPATGAQGSGYFNPEQAQLQTSFLSTGASTTPSSQYSLASNSSSSVASAHLHHSSHQRYPQHQAYPAPAPAVSEHQQQQAAASNRRATISGGLPFNPARSNSASSAAMAPSLSLGGRTATPPVTLDQAFASLEIALDYLSTRAGQDYVSPKDLVVLADLKGKMERARNSQGVSMAAISSAPPTPSGLGMSSAAPLNSPFGPAGQSGALAAAFGGPAKQQRMRLARTQSTSSVPFFGGATGAQPGMFERGALNRRSGSSLSLYEVDGH
ncbi:hypothetical protein Rhopal_007577-T1 [Rhodotorula paludigena]|uniref:HTH CENPB-type domain-containing protein n=1 Tax=Rhodotorula paludigena TaxID=86838 RepID=A0AAV5GX05_9BASI|nr:hypothetical protein Rhopal_007577-T1 [Rhodotorula paludigena]